MDQQALIYSANPTSTITDLKTGIVSSDTDTSKVEQRMRQTNIFALRDGTSAYHYKLATIKAHPYIMYGQGNLTLLDRPIIGIVGPRKMSTYAEQVLIKLFEILPHYDCVTISGLADGVDSLCHSLSIKNNIPTIAILGGGLGYFLQTSKRQQISDIVNHDGLVLSEFKLKQEPAPYTFPQRNRIIAGLSTILFVPEASEGSGSLITVHDALDMHKPVYGAPNTLFTTTSFGLLKMISTGKVKCIADMDEFLGNHFKKKQTDAVPQLASYNLSVLQTTIMTTCGNNPCPIETLLETTKIQLTDLQTELTILEMMGLIWQIRPGIYSGK